MKCGHTFDNIVLMGSRFVLSSSSSSSSSELSSLSLSTSSSSPSLGVGGVSSVHSSESCPSAKSKRALAMSLNDWVSLAFQVSNGFRMDLAIRFTVCAKHQVWLAGPGKLSRVSPRYLIIKSLLDALSPVMPSIWNACTI